MSVPAERKRRMDETKLNPREKARLEEERKNRKTRAQYYIIGAIVVVLAALVIIVNSSLFTNSFPALRVGSTSYPLADVNYEYQEIFMQLANYGMFDPSQSLKEQECLFEPDGGSWHDYFKNAAKENLVQKTAFYEAAKEAGTTLTDEDYAQIDSAIGNYSTYAASQGAGSLDNYLSVLFGAGNTEKTVRASMEKELLINRYLTDLQQSFEFSDEEKAAYYAENTDSLDKVNYVYSIAYATADEDAGVDEEAAMALAHETADTIVTNSEGKEDLFRAAAEELNGSASDSSMSVSSFLSQYGEEITADDLTEGTVFTHEMSSGVYTVYIKGVDHNDYNTVSVRHILVKAVDEDGDGQYSEEEKQTAYDAVAALQAEWEAGEATEESFAALAQEHSEDAGSVDNGGLYEGIYKGQMVPAFEEFCFAPHQKGDTDIVWGETSSYGGYHLIYFVGEGEAYSTVLAGDALRSDAYSEATTAMLENYNATEAMMWRYVMN